jgi:hypothetical protein
MDFIDLMDPAVLARTEFATLVAAQQVMTRSAAQLGLLCT